MNGIIAFWCGIGVGIIVSMVAGVITGAIWFASLMKPPKRVPSLREDAHKRERLLR